MDSQHFHLCNIHALKLSSIRLQLTKYKCSYIRLHPNSFVSTYWTTLMPTLIEPIIVSFYCHHPINNSYAHRGPGPSRYLVSPRDHLAGEDYCWRCSKNMLDIFQCLSKHVPICIPSRVRATYWMAATLTRRAVRQIPTKENKYPQAAFTRGNLCPRTKRNTLEGSFLSLKLHWVHVWRFED